MGPLSEHFWKKKYFSLWKVENIYFIYIFISDQNQNVWDRGGGVQKMEKNFFAFLDELDHLEAKKNINFLMENEGHLDRPPPLLEIFH